MSLSLVKDEAFKPDQHSIEECLVELEKYGHPRVSKSKNGWNSSIDVFVTGKGVEFEVRSEYGMKTPKVAINQCYERLIQAIQKIKDT
ncbi:hypothetical protein KAR91_08045 [Candidatus Pacearchaeota archaeon]|nr:hypothetical protein [Candidatus Pacearchaeota archaeon]